MKIKNKNFKSIALGLAFMAASGLATAKKAAADLFRFEYTSVSNFTNISDPSLGRRITSAYVTLDLDEGFQGVANGNSFVDWYISTKEGNIGYELKKSDPDNNLSSGFLTIANSPNGFVITTDWMLSAFSSKNHVTIYALAAYNREAEGVYGYTPFFARNYNEGPVGNWVTKPLNNNPVPEPSTVLLLGSGLAGIAALKRRKWRHIMARKNLPQKTLG